MSEITKPLTKKQIEALELKEDSKEVKKLLRKGRYKVYGIVTHVASSGMSRHIDFYVALEAGEIRCINHYIKKLAGYGYARNSHSILVSGCGMDMVFAVVDDLSRVLYKKGSKLKKLDL